jgi:putative restriction endonuclease
VTKVADRCHLIASHIKPWKVSDNVERLDGSNGLLLAPHVDWLFNGGYISFRQSGKMIVSPLLPAAVLQLWHIDPDLPVGEFTAEQEHYLSYHRKIVFKRTVRKLSPLRKPNGSSSERATLSL